MCQAELKNYPGAGNLLVIKVVFNYRIYQYLIPLTKSEPVIHSKNQSEG